ncbi:hypothetical protein A3860_34440 [Niastella vici]|uniref:Uncharacterized protein n=1 Tax=Niastella vici TaxID=1703345 RepID=A0A1V9FPJ3_9BACT|nr:hypothetical protein [Niastella vici]OQP60181.1 hypothetical protein A3860_34440 [Niastella vici]
MLKKNLILSEAERKEMENWIQLTFGADQNLPIDVLLLILYKIHLLEEKIGRIEVQTKTHWVD